MSIFNFAFSPMPPQCEALRAEVRAFLQANGRDWTAASRAQSWDGFDPEFSRKVGAHGWIGMTWPKRYGGGERSALERHVVLEEMLVAGAPVSLHWIADRQSGPLLLRFGTERQRREILPAIARGTLCFCIGMSEPDAGSDVANIRTRAVRTETGWRVTGTKLWTTNAHRAHYMIGLFRTSGAPADRQRGLSQFLVDMTVPGITVRPLPDLAGREHFNEVTFDGALLPSDSLLGQESEGWSQTLAELALERSGPERFLSSIQALIELIRIKAAAASDEDRATIGRLVAQLMTLRRMSLSVAGMLEAKQTPALEAAVVKDLGTGFEQALPETVQSLLGLELDRDHGTELERAMAHLVRMAPAYSLRGGTREILRGIIARGLGLR
ncbi:MAG: acyl-CoA dehydrogenase family protein [Alphaproteobacteria bacterium]|nr:acyl-CoA dehydrogenase family protein [Alphaproteobacteria bacterium]